MAVGKLPVAFLVKMSMKEEHVFRPSESSRCVNSSVATRDFEGVGIASTIAKLCCIISCEGNFIKFTVVCLCV